MLLHLSLLVSNQLNLGDIFPKLARVDLLLKPFEQAESATEREKPRISTYISSISAGVRRATSGSTNQAITTATAPAPAKLEREISRVRDHDAFKENSQESGLDSPFRGTAIDHQWGTEAEHDGNQIR